MDSQTTSDSHITFQNRWDAELYDSKHSFVSNLAADLVELLFPKPREWILDIGCGTGHLTAKIANSGAEVVGIDSAATMIEQARSHYPNLQFEVANATNLQFPERFDAVFSNAVLHWIKEPEKVVAGIYRVLKPGGRFVAEFGGKGNVKIIFTAILNAMQAAGYPVTEALNPWYFPSIGEYGTLLEQHGLQLTFASLFERPTPLNDGDKGMQNWIKMFANSIFQALPADKQTNVLADIEERLRPHLYIDGTWFADYKRIRVIAVKV
jgi:ubiquinone/menaquinone biosynthesis C-methylase UbiE